MTAQSTRARIPAAADAAATGAEEPKHGAEIFVPLNLLKASQKNARKVKHSEATLEGLAASIKAKGVLQPPVVEIERGEDGAPTGAYLVTIGEGRRLALRMLVKRKAIKRNHPVKVTVDTENDAHEISLDENITREAMHPADQFEAFKRLADERGYGPEEIGARFGVSAQTVRQRLRLSQPRSLIFTRGLRLQLGENSVVVPFLHVTTVVAVRETFEPSLKPVSHRRGLGGLRHRVVKRDLHRGINWHRRLPSEPTTGPQAKTPGPHPRSVPRPHPLSVQSR